LRDDAKQGVLAPAKTGVIAPVVCAFPADEESAETSQSLRRNGNKSDVARPTAG
jgi:hypothetical protein